MKRVAGVAIAVAVALAVAGVMWLQVGSGVSGQPAKAAKAPKAPVAATVKVPIAAKTYSLKALVAKVDPGHARQIYLVGYSNGARLAFRVACDEPTLFDGYASVKGGPTSGCLIAPLPK